MRDVRRATSSAGGAIGRVIQVHRPRAAPAQRRAAGPRGFSSARNTAASSATSAATRSSNSCIYAGATDATVTHSAVANYANPD